MAEELLLVVADDESSFPHAPDNPPTIEIPMITAIVIAHQRLYIGFFIPFLFTMNPSKKFSF